MSGSIGRFYGVGVGPGDPDLITVKARRVLSEVAVIFVPKGGSENASYARAIIAGLLSPGQEVVELVFPMTRDRQKLESHWQGAASAVFRKLADGKDCAFVTLGDPLLYGTFIPLMGTLRREHPDVVIEAIPGISSINAAASSALLPLAVSDESVAIISGRSEDSFIRQALTSFDTVVFLKVNSSFERLLGILDELGLVDRCVYVKRCTTPDEQIVRDIRQLQGQPLDYFSLLIFRR